MPGSYRSSSMSRRRRRQAQLRRRRILAGAALLAVIAIIVIVALSSRGGKDRPAVAAAATPVVTWTPAPTDAPPSATEVPQTQTLAQVQPTPAPEVTQQVTPAPTPEPTHAPTSVPASDAQRALTRPTPTAAGFLPVFTHASTSEKIVAITVDDCFQANNLQQIVDAALAVNGKLTIFPIGENVLREKQAQILKYAWENGFELENHTFTHNGLYRCSDEVLAQEVYKQQLSLSHILGVEYQCHFLRPMGGDARNDQRLQKYAEQLGYYGIAHWSVSGRLGDRDLVSKTQPGAIFLFHTTDDDLNKLVRFIPWLDKQGYRLVTLNEMFGYPDNETQPLTMKASEYPIPTLAPFERVLVPYKKTTYAYGVYLLQEKLIALGYLKGEPDGIYGDGSVNAIKAFQKDHGLSVTGVADVETQQRVFAQ